jgi:hypothetical protein
VGVGEGGMERESERERVLCARVVSMEQESEGERHTEVE